jgi:hypothetical protein
MKTDEKPFEGNPMAISMYRASVPVFLQMLPCLSALLDKAAAFAEAKKVDPSVLLNARLSPDMFALTRQVQIAADFAKGTVARLAGQEPPKYADDETTIPALKARIAKTLDFIKGFTPAQIDGSENREITMVLGGQPRNFQGENYLVGFALPNFYFHMTTAYAILRHNGVEIGKRDYMQPPG